MTERADKPDREPATAAEWFVAHDARPPDDVAAARFAAWLDAAPAHEIELERCSAAVEIAQRLAEDPELRWAYDEAAALAAATRSTRAAGEPRRRLWRFGWGAAPLLAIASGSALVWLAYAPESGAPALALPSANAATIVASAPPTDTAVLLPGRVVVDVSSVAVLPFAAAAGDERERGDLAGGLYREVVGALAAVPGLYVVAAPPAYASVDLTASEIGAQLGTRAIVLGTVAVAADRLRFSATVLDAATDELLWQANYDRPVGELRALQVDLVDHIAAALVDPELRARSLGARSARTDQGLASALTDAAPFE